ncbi:MAG: 30S ribosomal protein S6 [Verrucomicrobiales bacterium]|nr:30S ribosomal protein S6 [Verrucomicrobiales bacterium]
MKRKYESIYVLKLQGQEDSAEDLVGEISKELEGEGATLEQIDRLGKREFAYENHDKQKHGFFVQFQFESDPEKINSLRSKLALHKEIMLQHYRRK